jgi:hypothetical protein
MRRKRYQFFDHATSYPAQLLLGRFKGGIFYNLAFARTLADFRTICLSFSDACLSICDIFAEPNGRVARAHRIAS